MSVIGETASDGFDLIEVGANLKLSNDQRDLGAVAKILQFAASNKGVRLKINLRGQNAVDLRSVWKSIR